MITRAATSAAATAGERVLSTADVVNDPTGYPTQEIYPGAVDASQYGEGSGPRPPGEPGGPPYGSWGAEPFTGTLQEQAPGGGYQDTSWQTGHDAPQTAWDSSAGAPFAPSGPVNPLLHGEDTGAVYVREHVTPAEIGQLTRVTSYGQTTVRNGSGNQLTKDNVTAPNDRVNLDQQQWHNPDGYNPWEIPYSERPILNNLAWQNVPTSASEAPYGVAGGLSDRSAYDYSAVAYETPPDPSVASTALTGVAATSGSDSSGIGGGWL